MIEDRDGNVNLGVVSIEVMFEATRMDELSQREWDRKKDRGTMEVSGRSADEG